MSNLTIMSEKRPGRVITRVERQKYYCADHNGEIGICENCEPYPDVETTFHVDQLAVDKEFVVKVRSPEVIAPFKADNK
jgi:hypothetical protein